MKKPLAFKANQYYVPNSIQRLFTFTIGGLYLLQIAILTVATFVQSQEGSDFRPQLGFLVIYNLVPIVVFLIAYVLNPRKLSRLSRSFESLLIAISGYIGWSIVNMLIPTLLMNNHFSTSFRLYEYISSALFIGVFTAILIVLRKKGVWS